MLRLLGFFDDFGYSSKLAAGPLTSQDEAEIVGYLDMVCREKPGRRRIRPARKASRAAQKPSLPS